MSAGRLWSARTCQHSCRRIVRCRVKNRFVQWSIPQLLTVIPSIRISSRSAPLSRTVQNRKETPVFKKAITYFRTVHYYYGDCVSKRAADMVFSAMYTLTDLRVLLRTTAPSHALSNEQRAQAERLLENLERQVGSLKQEMLK